MIHNIFRAPYIIINSVFAGIIFLVIVYSLVFSPEKNNYPIHSACIEISGKPCLSTGLSRSFSELVRFNFEKAEKYNPHGKTIFGFLMIQLLLRIIFSSIYMKFKQLETKIIFSDSIVSIVLFLFTFAKVYAELFNTN